MGVGVCAIGGRWPPNEGVRLRAMSERQCFPFGQPVLPRPPSATGPRAVFVLGAYPSGFYVAWWLPGHEDRRTPDAKALIVDNEPEVFGTALGRLTCSSGGDETWASTTTRGAGSPCRGPVTMARLGSGFETRSLSRLAIAALTAGSPIAWTPRASTQSAASDQQDIPSGRRPPRAPYPEHGVDPDRRWRHCSGGARGSP
jgi:hypothetical protein